MIEPLSAKVIQSSYVEQQNRRTIPLVDYEAGGETLDSSQGSRYAFMWVAESDGSSVTVRRVDLEETHVVLSGLADVTQIAIAFDAAMRTHVAYVAGGKAYLYYWNSLAGSMDTMELDGAITPRLCTDQKRQVFVGTDDVILAYLRSGGLYCRYQRERFTVEHLITAVPDAIGLTTVGLNNANRLQWRCRPRPGWKPPPKE